MIHITNFIDRVSLVESRKSKDLVMPVSEARGLRDEIAKLLVELKQLNSNKAEEIIEVEITGGSFK